MQTNPETIKAQAVQIATGLAQILQPADIGLFIEELIAATTDQIRSGCDHGCSLLFLALMEQAVGDLLEEETNNVPASSVSPAIAAALLEVLGE